MFRFSYSIKDADFTRDEEFIDIVILVNHEKYREQILKFIEEHKEEMLGKLEQAVRMESFFDETDRMSKKYKLYI